MSKKKDLFEELKSRQLLPESIIETHCHLDSLKQLSIEEILSISNKVGIEKFITIAVSKDNLQTVFEISKNFEKVYCSQGIHPHEAKDFDDELLLVIKQNALNEKVVAIGEIGLDYHYNLSPKKKQIEVFEKHLELSSTLNLPVIIHTREAEEDTASILKNFSSTLRKKGVLHSFTSSMKLAEFALDEGFSLGFNGIISFKNAQGVRDVLNMTPVERILLETDAPYLTPIPFRGCENSPFYLPFVAKVLFDLKQIPYSEGCKIVHKNSMELFNKLK